MSVVGFLIGIGSDTIVKGSEEAKVQKGSC